jgi:transcriptional regulatory protein RtcR
MVRFNREAREGFMRFARSPATLWTGNFRDLWASVTRMATLAQSGRINEAIVGDEVVRLQRLWRPYAERSGEAALSLEAIMGGEAASRLDLFDAMQLESVVKVCRQSKSLSDAGRKLYGVSRSAKSKPNDADRLKKYLSRFGLSWDRLSMEST